MMDDANQMLEANDYICHSVGITSQSVPIWLFLKYKYLFSEILHLFSYQPFINQLYDMLR